MTLNEISTVRENLLAELDTLATASELDAFKLAHLTRKGTIAAMFDQLREVSKEEKPLAGRELNILRKLVEERVAEKEQTLSPSASFSHSQVDLSMPARVVPIVEAGHEHPLMKTLNEMIAVFERMGFAVEYGPEVEDDEHNFGKLNFAPDHPARDMQDTFFVKPNPNWTAQSTEQPLLLRTHTSPVQIRLMERQKPPIRAIMPGRVYRNEAISARSGVAFFQLEGLVVDRGVSMADLKGVLLSFARQFFGSDAKVRLRPSFFPFTEPSAEVDVSCYICGGKGCRVCKQSGWLEILGAGMVHPNVLAACGIDPEIYTGYAFGMGIDRTAMMRYGVSDIREFFENDYRFLEQF
ncbi:MAG TPA: phenylalanine--tRNA ligase subunit alpha [Candidatus Kapabacteria bacterium]|jgi:phenylalanyl-tRNA synthetase alpha chain|nr:phenylalanine--tRNA ligase subunit alpha [Candidatus Kapabacteria bacterium]